VPEPITRGWQRTIDGDWTCEVDQATYGHRSRKRTWLLYHGAVQPPELNWARTRGECQIGNFDRLLPILPAAERASTPPAFRNLLLSIAETAQPSAKGRAA
jgi:hypothetical protein